MQPSRFAIYTRISRDRVGAGLGVERQQADCEALVKSLGGTVVEVYSDNDVSAYSGKYRPGYETMMEAIRRGEIDSVAVWHQDRLLRRTMDLEHYIDVCQPLKVSTHTVKAGYFDLTTPAGRATAKTLAAWASYEVETSTDRVKAAKLQAAQQGKPSGGNRPYGYAQNGLDIIEHEAVIVTEVIERFVDGESWRQIAFDLNARSIPTAKGNKWSSINVRNVAVRLRNIGIREHNGNQYPAQWTPLIDDELWAKFQTALRQGRMLYGSRSYTRKHLLTGFIFCGLCKERMTIVSAQQRDGSYSPAFACRKKDQHGEIRGCGKVKRRKDPIEDLITDCVLYRLDMPDLGTMLAKRPEDEAKLNDAFKAKQEQELRVQEILAAYSTGDMTMAEWKAAKQASQRKLETLNGQITRLIGRPKAPRVPAGKTLQEAWEENGLEWRRKLLHSLIESIYVYPKQPGDGKIKYKNWIFNPDRVEIIWKV